VEGDVSIGEELVDEWASSTVSTVSMRYLPAVYIVHSVNTNSNLDRNSIHRSLRVSRMIVIFLWFVLDYIACIYTLYAVLKLELFVDLLLVISKNLDALREFYQVQRTLSRDLPRKDGAPLYSVSFLSSHPI